jgi:hypothetical protein
MLSKGAAALEDEHRSFLIQIIGLYQGPGDADAEGGKASSTQLERGQ